MAINYLDKTGLTNLWTKIKAKFVVKEFKTGSESDYKVLSDNNLTDELLKKINEAGSSSFTGAYTDLTGKPSIEGHEIVSGNQTAASLGLATPSDITTAVNDMATQTWVNEQGYQTASQVSSTVTSATADMATQTWVQGLDYQNSTQVSSSISTALADYAKTSDVTSSINSAISSTYKACGSVAFASLPTVADERVGNVYNVSDAFVTTEEFVEGSGKSYPAGTNVVAVDSDGKKWDVLSGFVDLSGYATTGSLASYVQSSELVAITSTEIDEICV